MFDRLRRLIRQRPAVALALLLILSGGVPSLGTHGSSGTIQVLITPLNDSSQTVQGGDTAIYLFRVTNNGEAEDIELSFTSTTTATFTYVLKDASGNVITSPTTIHFPADQSRDFSLEVTPNPAAPVGSSDESAVVAVRTVGGQTATQSFTTSVGPGDPLTLTKSVNDADAVVEVGQLLTFTIGFTNPNAFEVDSFTVTDVVSSSLTDITPSAGGSLSGSTITWDVGPIAAGASGSVSFTAVVAVTPDDATISNQASGGGPTVASGDSNVVVMTVAAPTLTLDKAVSATQAKPGDTLTYTVTYTVGGSDTLTDLVITDIVDTSQLDVTSVEGGSETAGTVTWNVGTVTPGTTGSVSFQATVLVVPDGTLITNQASGDGTEINPVQSSTVSTSVMAEADLVLVKGDSPDPVMAGSTLTYTLQVTNAGPNDSGSFTLTDTLPSGTTFQSGPGCTDSGGIVTCTSDGLAMSGSQTFTITTTVSPSVPTGTVLTNDAEISSAVTIDPDTSNNSASETTTVHTSADLQIVKTASPDPVVAGTDLTYTLTVTNLGPSDNTGGFTVTDVLAPDLTFRDATPGCSFVEATNTFSCDRGSLAAMASDSVTITVTTDAAAPVGSSIENTASVASRGTDDPDSSNDTSTVSTVVTTSADLEVQKTATPDPVEAGELLTYTITVTNHGPSANAGFTVTDTLAAGLTFDSASSGCSVTGQTVTCTSSDPLPFPGSISFTITARVSPSFAPGTSIVNNAAIASNITQDVNPANDSDQISTAVIATADLSLSKQDSPDPVIAGNLVTYTVAVTNQGPSDNAGFVVEDEVPEDTTFESAPGCELVDTVVRCTSAGLAAGATGTFTITLRTDPSLPQGSFITNTATIVQTSTPDDNPGNDFETISTSVITRADLSLVKTDSPDPVVAGTDLTYTLTVTNLGPSDNQGFSVTDTVPSGTTFVGASPECALAGSVVTCTSLGLEAGLQQAFTITVRVGSSVTRGSIITNTAAISAVSTIDPNAANDTSTTTTAVEHDTEISVSKTDNLASVVAGDGSHVYVITVTNAGPSDASGVQIVDTLPAGFVAGTLPSNCSQAGNDITCTIASIPAGQSRTVEIPYSVPSSTRPGTYTNSVALTSAHPGNEVAGNSATDDTEVTAEADLFIVKTDSPDPVIALGTLTYFVTVTNTGPSNNTGFSWRDVLPAGVSFVSLTGTGCSEISGVVECVSPGLAAGASQSWTIVVRLAPGLEDRASISNTVAIVATSTPDPDGSDDDSTAVTQVLAPTLGLVKTASPPAGSAVGPGQRIDYTVRLTNTGSASATGIVVTDTVSDLLGQVTAGSGGTFDPVTRVITWTRASLAAGSSVSFTFSGVPGATTSTVQLTNTATGIADQLGGPIESNTVRHTLVPPDVLIAKSGDRAEDSVVRANDVITYVLTVTNRSNVSALNVVVTDQPPPGLVYVPGSTHLDGVQMSDVDSTSPLMAGGVHLPSIGPNASRRITMQMRVGSDIAPGTLIENLARVAWNSNTQSSADFFRLSMFRPFQAPTLRQTILVQGPSGTILFVTVLNSVLLKGVEVLAVTGVESIALLLFGLAALGAGRSLTRQGRSPKRLGLGRKRNGR